MRSVAKREVLEAADWSAQRAEWWMDGADSDTFMGEPRCWELCGIDLNRPVDRRQPNPNRRLAARWAEQSSILYAAALEDGPMPAGWAIDDAAAARSVP